MPNTQVEQLAVRKGAGKVSLKKSWYAVTKNRNTRWETLVNGARELLIWNIFEVGVFLEYGAVHFFILHCDVVLLFIIYLYVIRSGYLQF